MEVAKASGLFDRIIVSSDSDEVGGIASRARGVQYHRGKAHGDMDTMYDVVEDVLSRYETLEDHYEYVCLMYACAPFTTVERLVEGYSKVTQGYDSAIPVYAGPHCERAMFIRDGALYPRDPLDFVDNSNYWADSLYPAGGWWWASHTSLMMYKRMFGSHNWGVVVGRDEIQEIDIEEDWADAERRYGA